MKNEIGTLEDYMRFIDGKMNHLRKLDGDLSKEEWEIILTHEGFAEKYIVTKTPDILKNIQCTFIKQLKIQLICTIF